MLSHRNIQKNLKKKINRNLELGIVLVKTKENF